MVQCEHSDGRMVDPANAMGFPSLTNVSTLNSIAHLFGSTKKRCGIYFLAFKPDFFYVGQAVDVVRRFSQHRKKHDDMIGFSFIAVSKPELDSTEKVFIFKAESLGIKITNAVHVTSILGDTDFDLVMPPEDQESWLNRPSREYCSFKVTPKIVLPEAQTVRFSKHFDRFNTHPLSPRALALLKQYIDGCIPAPRRTEYSFWAVSCMPSGSNTWPRLLCVNAAFMELFVIGWERQNAGVLWSFVNVADDVLLEHWKSLSRLKKAYPFLRFERRAYRDAGQHQLSVLCEGGAPMEQVLADPGISKAAATLALRIMRKRATIFGKYHCPQLANLALLV